MEGKAIMEGTCQTCGQAVTASDAFCGRCGEPAAPAERLAAPATPLAAPATPLAAPATPLAAPATPLAASAAAGSRWLAGTTGTIPADAATSQRTLNPIYLGQRLLYDKDPEQPFDPLFNPSLLSQFAAHWAVYWLACFICEAAVAIVFVILTFAVGAAGFILWALCGALIALFFACLYWLLPIQALLSEWKFPVDGQAAAAPATFEHISWALSQHQTPLDLVQIRRLKLDGDKSRDYLEIRRGLFTGFIACFAYGQDLYVGWTFWVRISPARYLLMFLGRIWQTAMRRGTDLHVTLRFDYARAMREAMHSVAREGVEVAAGQLHAAGAGATTQISVAVSDLGA
jgi:hypothetical protein